MLLWLLLSVDCHTVTLVPGSLTGLLIKDIVMPSSVGCNLLTIHTWMLCLCL